MENLEQYLKTLKQGPTQTADFVESLNDSEKVELRQALEVNGCKQLVRSLFYNYKTQKWI